MRVDVTLHKGIDRALRFVIALATSAQEAFDTAGRILEAAHGTSGSMVRAAALRLGMSGEELDEAMGLVLPLWENRLSGAEPKSTLWRWSISGDYPLLCCRAGAAERDRLLRAFCLLKCCGLESELVYLTDEHGEYRRPALREIEARLTAYGLEALLGARGGVLTAPTSAEAVLRDRAAVFIGEKKKLPPPLVPALPASGRGGEIPACRWVQDSFVYEVNSLPPRIWQHVLTNGSLSAFAADFGPAGLWLQNAREMRLLPPPEDIRATGGAEAVYAMVNGEAVSLFADGLSLCEVSYAPGLAVWRKEIAGREIETTLIIPMGLDVRMLQIRGAEELTLGWELCPRLGTEDAAGLRIEERDGLIRLWDEGAWLPGTELYVGASVPIGAESEFCPAALRLRLQAEDTTLLLLGTDAEALRFFDVESALRDTRAWWREYLGRFRLDCPDAALSHYMNTWAVYQCYACRILSRSSIYQSGGAVGFRDQLQDCANLLLIDPALCRAQILDCCRHQYGEGDVMHWWHRHPAGDRGVRTRCSDDLVWLVWALCEYTEATGDLALCDVEASFVQSVPLRDDERDRYETPKQSEEHGSVLEHAVRTMSMV